MDDVIAAVLAHLDRADPGGVAGVYLYGSATVGGLRPESDIDLLVVVRRSLDRAEREALVRALLPLSGWAGHGERFPEAMSRRPVELTVVVAGDVAGWEYPPRRDFQYGEWLRHEFVNGVVPEPDTDPDLPLLLATALASSRVLRGPGLADLVEPVPPTVLRRAALDSIPGLLADIDGDERNVLLTLARLTVTLESGRIVPKDVAAEEVGPRLDRPDRALLERARDGYRGAVRDQWGPQARALARRLADLARRAGDQGAPPGGGSVDGGN